MSKSSKTLSKGPKSEELLRSYFLKAGYYVVRGVPLIYEGQNVTDIDLWLYSRTSAVSREITLVDAKNKKTPQAIERIFWVQGLCNVTKATNAIVATTDKREEVKNFGRDLGILVLDGNFLAKLSKDDPNVARLSDEEFFNKIDEYALNKLDGNWQARIRQSKSLLAKPLSFDSCNEWLRHGNFFAEQSITKETQREIALRCLYLICSFIAIAIDYCMKEISFLEHPERTKLVKDGFTYGSRGKFGLNKVLDVAMGLVKENISNGSAISREVRANVEKQLAQLNTTILGEFFSKSEVSRTLFQTAIEFEKLAMTRQFTSHESASVELRSMLFCLIDFWGIDRVMFSNT